MRRHAGWFARFTEQLLESVVGGPVALDLAGPAPSGGVVDQLLRDLEA